MIRVFLKKGTKKRERNRSFHYQSLLLDNLIEIIERTPKSLCDRKVFTWFKEIVAEVRKDANLKVSKFLEIWSSKLRLMISIDVISLSSISTFKRTQTF